MPVRLAAAALLCLPIAACAVVQEKTLGESFDEASASNQIKARLLAAGTARFSEVDVEVVDRFALLSGRVATPEDRLEAERIAREVRTIDDFANELVVGPRSLGREVNDEWITARVRSRLISDAAIKGVNYNIETFDGVVYLLGLAQSEDELRRAAEHASMVRGVERVVSYVRIRDRAPVRTVQSPTGAEAPAASVYRDPYERTPGPDLPPPSLPASPPAPVGTPLPDLPPPASGAPPLGEPGAPTDLRPRDPDGDLAQRPGRG